MNRGKCGHSSTWDLLLPLLCLCISFFQELFIPVLEGQVWSWLCCFHRWNWASVATCLFICREFERQILLHFVQSGQEALVTVPFVISPVTRMEAIDFITFFYGESISEHDFVFGTKIAHLFVLVQTPCHNEIHRRTNCKVWLEPTTFSSHCSNRVEVKKIGKLRAM